MSADQTADAGQEHPPALEHPPCPLCGCDKAHTLLTSPDRVCPLPGEFGAARCESCGHVYTRPRPVSLAAHYPPDYAPHADAKPRRSPWTQARPLLTAFAGYPGWKGWKWLLAPAWPAWRLDARHAEVVPWAGQGRLFDFGCGGGAFLSAMRRLGWTVSGADISPQAVAACMRAGLNVRQGTFPMPSVPSESVDVVTMRHSLEHTPHPRQAVAEARRILTPGGLLFIGVPLFDSWASQYFGPDSFSLDLPRHLNHFTRGAMTRLLTSEGFSRVRFLGSRRRSAWTRSLELRRQRLGRSGPALAAISLAARVIEALSAIAGHPSHAVFLARRT